MDYENKNPLSALVTMRKAIKRVSSDMSHILSICQSLYHLALVGENYLDRAFKPAGSFIAMGLFWIFVILGIYFMAL